MEYFYYYWSIWSIFFLLFFIFVIKNRNIKKKLAANLETIAIHTSSFLGHTRYIFHKSVHATKDYTYNNLKNIIENKYLVLISSGKDSCVIILKRSDYDEKLQSIIKNGVTDGTYSPTADTTLSDLKKFQDIWHCNSKDKSTCSKHMRTVFVKIFEINRYRKIIPFLPVIQPTI